MIFSKKTYFTLLSTLIVSIIFLYLFIDRAVGEYFLANASTYRAIGKTISISGESHWYIATALLGFLFFKYYKKNTLYGQRFLFLFYINIFSGLISVILKWLFGRVRPWGLKGDRDEYGFLLFDNFDMSFIEKIKFQFATLIESPGTYTSFPSGHTTTIMSVATYLSLLFPRYIYLWFTVALISASSRVIAYDHYISDIFAGFIVGTISTIFLYSKMSDRL
jgi:membrane-associated phospholipid phosphatase